MKTVFYINPAIAVFGCSAFANHLVYGYCLMEGFDKAGGLRLLPVMLCH